MTTEHLIEEAAIAIHSVAESGASWFDARMADKAQHRAEARAVLAVFEEAHTVTDGSVHVTARHSTPVTNSEAHTPTNDEREALADRLARRLIADPKQLMLAEGTGALHVALSDSIRSVIEDVYADCGDSDAGVLSSNIARRLAWDLPPVILADAGFRRSEVPEQSAEHECSWACGVDKYGQDYHLERQGKPSDVQVLAQATRISPPFESTREAYEWLQSEPSDALTIPRPHVPFGPQSMPEHEADATYLDHAADSLEGHYEVGGSNVRATVVKLLRDTAAALRAAGGVR